MIHSVELDSTVSQMSTSELNHSLNCLVPHCIIYEAHRKHTASVISCMSVYDQLDRVVVDHI